MMKKLLVNTPQDEQVIIEVGQGGRYDAGPVLWDERKDGAFPVDLVPKVGGLVRAGAALQFDPAAFASRDAKKKDDLQKQVDAIKRKQDRRAGFQAIKLAKNVDDLKAILSDLLIELGYIPES